jgi:DNA repair exonuclease SbcCD ATPase subunit
MTSLALFNSSEAMSFLALSVVFLFVGPAIFVGIVTMWANLKQKISYELTKIAYESIDSAVSVEVGKIKHEISANLTAEINTAEINTEELYSRVSEINDKSTAEINKIKNEISNFTAEIKARDNAFSSETNRISASLNTIANKISEIEKILEQHHNNFCEISSKFAPINSSIEILQNDMAQRYAVIPRPDFDQQSVCKCKYKSTHVIQVIINSQLNDSRFILSFERNT